MVCDIYGDQVAPIPAGVYGIAATAGCPGDQHPTYYTLSNPPGGMAIWTGGAYVNQGTAVHWTVSAPPGMTITGIYIPHMYSMGIDDGTGWGGGFYWAGGGVSTWDTESGWSSATTAGPGFTWPGATPYFGWQVVCGVSLCTNGGAQWLSVELLELNMQETSGPYLVSPDGLWQTSSWIRGVWPIHFYGDSPSGLCDMEAYLNGQEVAGSNASSQNGTIWHQCSAPQVDQGVNTAKVGQGALALTISGHDAANLPVSYSKTVYVDNTQPTVSFSGPSDAPTTAGTQYVTATASGGPSGISGVLCSLDGGASRWYAASSAQIAVGGLGDHLVRCAAAGNAVDGAGNRGWSSWTAHSLSIRQPTVSFVSFAHVADALRCRRIRERVHIPAHWVTATYKGHPVRIKLPALRRTVKVVHCHPRIVRRRMRVHGHWRAVRAVVLPHTVSRSTIRVRHGAGATVSGWLGTSNGNALGGQSVYILTAPDDGHPSWTQAAIATTTASGTWTANLPAGPSRLVMASYGGASTVEPANSASARVLVPARVRLGMHPTSAHWGGSIVISGRLKGGYIPTGGELVVLWIGWPGGSTEIGHVYTRSNGRFRTRYTFLRGSGTLTYRLWATTARESDYPYAPASSRRVWLTVQP
jgi:hypothetical protein